MRIEKCYFCSVNIYPGHGSVFVRNDSKHFRFCSSKCTRLFKAKKNPRKLAWTKASRVAKGKEMTNDTVLEFEQRRNEPVRYNRDLMVETLQVMKKIDDIKKRRQQRFFDRRMAKAAAKKRSDVENELMTHVDLISDPKIKEFIAEKKVAKLAERRARQDRSGPKKTGIWAKDAVFESSSEEEEVVAAPVLAKIKAKTAAAKKPAAVAKRVTRQSIKK